jgi:hypothetical protein
MQSHSLHFLDNLMSVEKMDSNLSKRTKLAEIACRRGFAGREIAANFLNFSRGAICASVLPKFSGLSTVDLLDRRAKIVIGV